MIWIVTGILVYLAVDRIITQSYVINAPVMAITAGVGVLVNLLMGALLYFGGHSHSHGGLSHGGHSHATRRLSSSSATNGHGHSHSNSGSREHVENGASYDPLVNEETMLLAASLGEGLDVAEPAQNINIRAAFIHVIGDLLQSVGVLLAAFLILFNENWGIVDPICTLMFSVIVMSTTVYIVRDALVVLLEGRPSNIDFRVVFDALERIDGVRKVHDLRIWALTMNKVAISVHLEVDPGAQAQTVLKTTTLMLRKNFNVHESTVQIEGYQPELENCTGCTVPAS